MTKQVNDEYPNETKPMTDAELKAIATAKFNSKSTEEEVVYDFPTEIVELPSRGKLYPKDHPLASGKVEMKYMTAKEEDILTNQSFIKQGVVLDKLFKSMIVSPIQYHELLLCDKNAIMVAARILGYGKEYPIKVSHPESGEDVEHIVDLTKLGEKEINWDLITEGKNEFVYELPHSKRHVTLSLLTHGKQRKIDQEMKGLAKLKKNAQVTTMLKYVITAIDGDSDNNKIRQFVDNHLLAIDSRALRSYLKQITPDINLSVEIPDGESGDTFPVTFTFGLDFFWPDAEL